MVSILRHEQYFFLFHASSCSNLMSHHHWVNNKCNNSNNNSKRMTLKIANLCPTYFLLHNNVTCFQKQPPLFLKVSQIPHENNCVGVSFLKSCRPASLFHVCFSDKFMLITSNHIVCINTSMGFQ